MQVIGNDLSPVQSNWYVLRSGLSRNKLTARRVPPNVKFEVDDVESEWTYDFKFDFIFCRYMTGSIVDWPKLVGRIFECARLNLPRPQVCGT